MIEHFPVNPDSHIQELQLIRANKKVYEVYAIHKDGTEQFMKMGSRQDCKYFIQHRQRDSALGKL